jgi:hypothetical protein
MRSMRGGFIFHNQRLGWPGVFVYAVSLRGNRPSAAPGGSRGLTYVPGHGHGHGHATAYLLQGPSTTGNKPPRIERRTALPRVSASETLFVRHKFTVAHPLCSSVSTVTVTVTGYFSPIG